MRFLANVTNYYAVARPSVVRLSVTFVHPTQPVDIFGNISTPLSNTAIFDISKVRCWTPFLLYTADLVMVIRICTLMRIMDTSPTGHFAYWTFRLL